MSSTNTPIQNQECCICLQPAQTRNGYQFLTTPGCCGKWFHQSCLTDFMNNGCSDCPHCRRALPTLAQAPAPPHNNHRVRVRLVHSSTGYGTQSSSLDPTYQQEDPILKNDPASSLMLNEASRSSVSDSAVNHAINLKLIPEFPVESLEANLDFHVRVSVEFQDMDITTGNSSQITGNEERNPLDIVCVIDNSGSMTGEKIQNVKKAIEFVLSCLNAKDRLSIITFNSYAKTLMNLKRATPEMKDKVRNEVLSSIKANGGTKIFKGLNKGYQILKNRVHKNPNSVMFLLTDGQDSTHLAEKKAMAREMRVQQGTALFVFGFGADHDSKQMQEIANACEGSFVYIDTNDTVVEAFGGAIGSQQGHVLRNISIDFSTALSPNVALQSISSGIYTNQIERSKTSGKVMLMDLFRGEKRDFLISLAIPAVDTEIMGFPIMTASATYSNDSSSGVLLIPTIQCQIDRLNSSNHNLQHLRVRDVLVDEDIFRVRCTQALADAMSKADANQFNQAKEILDTAITLLQSSSVAYRSGNSGILNGMLSDLQDCLRRTRSREEYQDHGGRAMMSEHHDGYSKQRKVYKKGGVGSDYYQTSGSRSVQARSRDYDFNHFEDPFFGSSSTFTPAPLPLVPPPVPIAPAAVPGNSAASSNTAANSTSRSKRVRSFEK